MGRIVSNLLNNSIEAICDARSPEIEIFVRDYRDKIAIYVKDNGKGIPEKLLPQVGVHGFTHGKPIGHGNGLGVSYAKQKVGSWGGELQIVSRENESTIVSIFLLKA